jgi:hypothetical protein
MPGNEIGGGPVDFPPGPLGQHQPAYKPGSVGKGEAPSRDDHSSATPVARRLEQPTRTAGSGHRSRGSLAPAGCEPRAVPIRSCSRWGLPCRLRCRRRGALLPHRFTLTARSLPSAERDGAAVCSLWHFPWAQHPPDVIRHRMPMEPGLSSRTAFRPWPERPSSRLTHKGWGLLGLTSRPRRYPAASRRGVGLRRACSPGGCASRAAMRLLSVAMVEPSTKPSTRCGRK